MKKFIRVDLDKELRADFEHEVMMSFYDDSGAYAFTEWWDEIGAIQFNSWLKHHKEFKEDYEE